MDWCQCRYCSSETLTYMGKCWCFTEIPAIAGGIQYEQDSCEDFRCITNHPYFSTLWLDIDVEVQDLALLLIADIKADTVVRSIPSSW